MQQKEVLIYDADHSAQTLVYEFRRLGWNVHETCDEIEAGHRLLVWHDPGELPELAILNPQEANGLLDFCSLLQEEGILARLPVIVLLDETLWEAVEQFERLGVIPIAKSRALWPQIKFVVDQLSDSSADAWRFDPPESVPRDHSVGSSRLEAPNTASVLPLWRQSADARGASTKR
jgi:hypothetical protein